ncbi:MAG: hypothetical protein ABJZ55_08380 [Fuerstiella sp.]
MSNRQKSGFDHHHSGFRKWGWSQLAFVCQAAVGLLAAWWKIDRIRVSPTTGRLLSLRHGDHILLQDRLFDVQQVDSTSEACFVSYTLACESQSAILKVKRDQNGVAIEGWLESNGEHDAVFDVAVFDDDVIVLSEGKLDLG